MVKDLLTHKDYLLDTNIAGYLAELKSGISSKKTYALSQKLYNIPKESKIFFCSITIGEIEYGYQVSPPHMKNDILLICNYLQGQMIINIDQNIARETYSILRAKLFEKYAPKSGKKKKRVEEWMDPTTSKQLQIQENDVWISAVAMNLNLILVSEDKLNAIRSVTKGDLEIEQWLD